MINLKEHLAYFMMKVIMKIEMKKNWKEEKIRVVAKNQLNLQKIVKNQLNLQKILKNLQKIVKNQSNLQKIVITVLNPQVV